MAREALVAFLIALATDKTLRDRWSAATTPEEREAILNDSSVQTTKFLDEKDRNALKAAKDELLTPIAFNNQHTGARAFVKNVSVKVDVDVDN